MKRLFSFFFLVIFNLLFVFILLEVGVRFWVYAGQESFETFSNKISSQNAKKTEKRKIEKDNVALGDLIQKSAHAGRVYEFMPEIEAKYLGKMFQTNSFGMREDKVSLDKDDAVYRIAGIGDSVMFGWGVEQSDTYLKVLQRNLNAKDHTKSYETLNFGIPGYNTAMEVDTYEHVVRKFNPDLLIMHFVDNDLSIPFFMTRPDDLFSLESSFLFKKLWDFYETFKKEEKSAQSFVGVEFKGEDAVDKKKVLSQYQYMLGKEGFNKAMKKLSSMLCEDKIPMVILVGRLQGDMGRMLKTAAEKYGFHLVEVYEIVNRYVKDHNIEDTPAARKKLLWIHKDDPHPNELGHRLYAEALSEKLENILSESGDSNLPFCP